MSNSLSFSDALGFISTSLSLSLCPSLIPERRWALESGYGYNPLMDPKLISLGVDLPTRAVSQACRAPSPASLLAFNSLSHLNSLMAQE